MAVTRGDMKTQIWGLLNKVSTNAGFYTSSKLDDAIQDCLDFVAVEMFMAGEGWLSQIGYITTVANTPNYALPTGMAILNEVRYLSGDAYVPISYDDRSSTVHLASTSGVVEFPGSYRIVNNELYFNPPPAEVGTNYVQLEYTTYTAALANDAAIINAQFDNCLLQYVKWRAASLLASQLGKVYKEWEKYEEQWYGQMIKITSKRMRHASIIKEFEG